MSDESEVEGKSLQERVKRAGFLIAAAGAIWFALLTALSGWVYAPTGVTTRDLGLSASSVLVQATVALALCVVLGVFAGGLAGGALGAWSASRDSNLRSLAETTPMPLLSNDPASNASAVALLQQRTELTREEAEEFVQRFHQAERTARFNDVRAALPPDVPDDVVVELVGPVHDNQVRAVLRGHLVWISAVFAAAIGVVLALVVGLGIAIAVAADSRAAIQSGKAPTFVFGLPPPWAAAIAEVSLAPNSAPGTIGSLPPCALFLGQNDSTIYLRDSNRRTIRIPSSTVRLDLLARRAC